LDIEMLEMSDHATSGILGHVVRMRRHYPVMPYALTVLCALGLASVALGIVDGWALTAAGVAAITVSLVRLHVILDRRRAAVGVTPLPLDGGRRRHGRP
jgi:hypothetical protein